MTFPEPEEFYWWRRRITAEHAAGNLTRARRDALLALMSLAGPDGLFPSDAIVAERAKVHPRTVRRARMDARALGLLNVSGGRWRP